MGGPSSRTSITDVRHRNEFCRCNNLRMKMEDMLSYRLTRLVFGVSNANVDIYVFQGHHMVLHTVLLDVGQFS